MIVGIILAGGGGRRMGTPKAILTLPSGQSYVAAAAHVLCEAGCEPVLAVLGAEAEEAAATLTGIRVVRNDDWREGMSTSLRAGLLAVINDHPGGPYEAAVIHLVDLPDVTARVVERIIGAGRAATGGLAEALVRSSYDGAPGHPVLIGAKHFDGVLASLQGDAGARGYLNAHGAHAVEVSDLATGRDLDTPQERLAYEARISRETAGGQNS